MVQIEDSVLGPEIAKIIGNKNAGIKTAVNKIIVHTVQLDIPITMIESIETYSDYNTNIGDYILATFMMPMGDYVKDVYPFRDNLEITITKLLNGIQLKTRFKFVITNNLGGMTASRYTNSTREELNKMEHARIEGQCVDRLVEVLRLQQVSGVYKNSNVKDLIHSAMLTTIGKIKINDTPVPVNLTVMEPDNNVEYNNIRIPTGTSILDLPSYLQAIDYGVYNGNIGTYVKRTNCTNPNNPTCLNNNGYDVFVYPLYNDTAFDKVTKKLIVYAVNSVKFEMVENTYLVDGDIVKIIAGGSTRTLDNAENNMIDKGIGYVQTDPNLILERSTKITVDGVVVDTNNVNSASIAKNRLDGGNGVQHISVASNMYPYRSDTLKASMMIVQLQWNYSNPELIYPGMPVMYIYLDNSNGIIKLKGTVQSIFTMENQGTKTINSFMNIMVDKPFVFPDKTLSNKTLYDSRAGINK